MFTQRWIKASFALATALIFSSPLAAAHSVSLELVAEGLTAPISFSPLPDGTALIVEQTGYVRLWEGKGKVRTEPVLNWTNHLCAILVGGFDERGTIGLAVHPSYPKVRKAYLTYSATLRASAPTNFDSTLRLAELTFAPGEPLRLDPQSERILLEIDKPYMQHNSGRLAFGPDGFLYMSVGDGGNANDEGKRPETGNGQNLQTHMGKILRIDVNAPNGHGIPPTNPFADGKEGLPEIYAYGLRNPWGMSFDKGGDHGLYEADVGQNLFEEVNRIELGGNYGWRLREGFTAFNPKDNTKPLPEGPKVGARGEPLKEPIAVYKNVGVFRRDPEAYGMSITGGYVYRGKALADLPGDYIFGDWSRSWAGPMGVLLAAHPSGTVGEPWKIEQLTVKPEKKMWAFVVAFGQDNEGELYVLGNETALLAAGKGKIWKIVPAVE
ncbi:MAG TPA: PQQ-dependent sugar dehydrogenase [Candidatus Limnocylindria bacterium]|nr:PQQ-dependent sugar dehydrogenase [Candidatus Limnocylindria bacterium]